MPIGVEKRPPPGNALSGNGLAVFVVGGGTTDVAVAAHDGKNMFQMKRTIYERESAGTGISLSSRRAVGESAAPRVYEQREPQVLAYALSRL